MILLAFLIKHFVYTLSQDLDAVHYSIVKAGIDIQIKPGKFLRPNMVILIFHILLKGIQA